MFGIASAIHRSEDAQERAALSTQLLAAGWLLGLLDAGADGYFQQGSGLHDDEIERLISERKSARTARDFARADQIRDDLLARGIELEDTRDGTRWKSVTAAGDS